MTQTLDFSDKTPCTGPQPLFSPNGTHIALAQEYRLVVRDVDSLAVVAVFSCLDRIQALAWSPSGENILCGLYARSTVQVFSLTDQEWTASISEGLAGVVAARWCPSGHEILLTSDFKLKLSVWSLRDQSYTNLVPAKHEEAGVAFSPDGSMLAVLERSGSKDTMAVYSSSDWELISRVALPTLDSRELSWSPDSAYLAVWDGPAHGHKIVFYTPVGELLATQTGHRDGLGVKAMSWSPSGQLLTVGTFDQDVSVLNHASWSPLAHFYHPCTVALPISVTVYKEQPEQSLLNVLGVSNHASVAARAPALLAIPPAPLHAPGSRGTSPQKPSPGGARLSAGSGHPSPAAGRRGSAGEHPPAAEAQAPCSLARQLHQDGDGDEAPGDEADAQRTRYAIADLPMRLPVVRPLADRPHPRLGVSLMAWSPDGAYLATRCDSSPQAAWIWDSASLQLMAVLVHVGTVRAMAWEPSQGTHRLALVSGAARLHFWTPDAAACVRIPVQRFKAVGLTWKADGSALLLVGRDSFCCAYFGGKGGPGDHGGSALAACMW